MGFAGMLRVYMLGGSEMYYNGALIQLKKKLTSKPVQLLHMLLYHRESGVSRHYLLESLYGQETEIDAANSLNATVSQLRKLLRETHLPEENYIKVRFDRYFFEASFPIWVDTEQAISLRQKADLLRGSERTKVLYQMCDLYHGRFLPELDGEDWVEIIRAHYQRIYRDSLNEVCCSLKENRAYNEILQLTDFAAKVFPFDEWQVWQQEALLAQGRIREAHDLYKRVEKLYMTELDAPPPEKMRARFRKPKKESWRNAESLLNVKKWLSTAASETPSCIPFPGFLDTYNLVRNISRSTQTPFCMMLCTLKTKDGRSAFSAKEWNESMEQLENAISQALRAEDVFTRYSRSQFLAILIGAKTENHKVIFERISSLFYSLVDFEKFTLDCQMLSGDEMLMPKEKI